MELPPPPAPSPADTHNRESWRGDTRRRREAQTERQAESEADRERGGKGQREADREAPRHRGTETQRDRTLLGVPGSISTSLLSPPIPERALKPSAVSLSASLCASVLQSAAPRSAPPLLPLSVARRFGLAKRVRGWCRSAPFRLDSFPQARGGSREAPTQSVRRAKPRRAARGTAWFGAPCLERGRPFKARGVVQWHNSEQPTHAL